MSRIKISDLSNEACFMGIRVWADSVSNYGENPSFASTMLWNYRPKTITVTIQRCFKPSKTYYHDTGTDCKNAAFSKLLLSSFNKSFFAYA